MMSTFSQQMATRQRTFSCKCGTLVTTPAKNKYQCDKCQALSNAEASRRASRRQAKRNRAKLSNSNNFGVQLSAERGQNKKGAG